MVFVAVEVVALATDVIAVFVEVDVVAQLTVTVV